MDSVSESKDGDRVSAVSSWQRARGESRIQRTASCATRTLSAACDGQRGVEPAGSQPAADDRHWRSPVVTSSFATSHGKLNSRDARVA